MTPLQEGSLEPVRGGAGKALSEKPDSRTLEGGKHRRESVLLSGDDARPAGKRKRAKRRQRGRGQGTSLPEKPNATQGLNAAPTEARMALGQDSVNKNPVFKKRKRRRKSCIASSVAGKGACKNAGTAPANAQATVKGQDRAQQARSCRCADVRAAGAKSGYGFTATQNLAKTDTHPANPVRQKQPLSFSQQESAMTQSMRKNRFSRPAQYYAALDLGTNNCRLLIATPTKPGHFRVVDAFSRIVRLGEGIGRSNQLSKGAMDRAIEALKVCNAKLAQCNISHQRLIATEACRSAVNGADFIKRVRSEAGLDLEVVDRETEARLAVSGCGTLVEPETEAIVLFDIGGGSSEIALIDISKTRSPRLAEHIVAWTSLPVGVVTLAERFGGETVTPDSFQEMKAYVLDLLNSFGERNKLGDLIKSPNFHLLGTSGTVTTLAGIHLELDRYDRRRVDGMWMQSSEVTCMTQKLLSWDMRQRVANPCIGADRADLVLAGCAILEAIRVIWPSQRLRVADRGLREGILTELMSRHGAWRKGRSSSLRRRGGTDRIRVK